MGIAKRNDTLENRKQTREKPETTGVLLRKGSNGRCAARDRSQSVPNVNEEHANRTRRDKIIAEIKVLKDSYGQKGLGSKECKTNSILNHRRILRQSSVLGTRRT
jgi:hypothetical protein